MIGNNCSVEALGIFSFKDSVQRKLRWVFIGANRWVLVWDCGAEHYFYFLLHRHLALNIFPFSVTTPKLIGEAHRMDVCASPIISCSLCCANTIGAMSLAPPHLLFQNLPIRNLGSTDRKQKYGKIKMKSK
jgi:hypothetical protein